MRVPENVVPGKAVMRIELESSTGKKANVAELPVTITKGDEKGRSDD